MRNIEQLANAAGIHPVLVQQPSLTSPSHPAISATQDDRNRAWNLLVEQRRNRPDYRDPDKQLKRIFRSSKEKEKLQDPSKWDFSQEELDQALLTAINEQTARENAGLAQAFLDLGAKVNIIDISGDKKTKGKKNNATLTRRSTVLQHAASMRRTQTVGVLARYGADQVTLDEGLRAALAAKDLACTEELLRHGADLNKYPSALKDAVWTKDAELVRLLLRSPRPLRPEFISPCLNQAVQQRSEPIMTLLVGYGADPNFEHADAFKQCLHSQEYKLAVAMAAGPKRISQESLRGTLGIVSEISNFQELQHFVELLLCCGLPPDTDGLADFLTTAVKMNRVGFVRMLLSYNVSAALKEAEGLKIAIAEANWQMVDLLLTSSISPAQASAAVRLIPANASRRNRYHVIESLVQKGATGPSVSEWLSIAVEEDDHALLSLLVSAGAPLDNKNSQALRSVVQRKDIGKLKAMVAGRPSPAALSHVFPLFRKGYSKSERLEATQLLLGAGAQGCEVDQALLDAVADTTSSRDDRLVQELVRNHANVNYKDGEVVQLAVTQGAVSLLELLCTAKPSVRTASAALTLVFGANGRRHATTLEMIELLLNNGVSGEAAAGILRLAIVGGPQNLDVVHRLMRHDAKLAEVAFLSASKLTNEKGKLPIIAALLKIGIPHDQLDRALLSETQTGNNHLTVIKLLLEHGASVDFEEGEAIKVAATSGSINLVQILLSPKSQPSPHVVTKTFRALFHDPHSIKNHDAVNIARELLNAGVEQPAIDSALRTTLDELNWNKESGELVDLLLEYGANVNTADGTCFSFAARNKEFDLFSKLLAQRPDFNVIVPCLLMSKLDEPSIMQALELCFKVGCSSETIDSCKRLKYPLLIVSMLEYPRGAKVVTLLLDNGCSPDVTVHYIVDEAVGLESISVLLWTLARPQKTVSDAVILALIQAGASINRRSPTSEMCPLAIAAREGRIEIVKDLIHRGAEVSARDRSNRSPLFYASSNPVTSIVQFLCQAKALKDDGSLHEAARELRLDNATVLIQHGHSPNFPSRIHGGRNALGEVCLGVQLQDSNARTKLRRMIRLLLDGNANAKFQARNEKSSVILALDNPYDSLEVSEALLETELWEDLNDEKHMFRDESGFWYSPIKYAQLVSHIRRERQKRELVELFKDKGCQPRYYSENPEQPDGAVGLPPAVAQLADRHNEHKLQLRLASEADEHARTLAEAAHRDMLRRKQEQEDAEHTAMNAMHAKRMQLEQSKHEFDMQRVRQAEAMKREEKDKWHLLQIKQEQEAGDQRQKIEDRKMALAMQNEGRMIQQRNAEMDYRHRQEQRALLDKEQVFERNVNRQKQLTAQFDESAKLHSRLRQERPPQQNLEWGSVD